MLEPNWDDEKYGRQDAMPNRDDVVWVTKKTRGRFGPLDVAQPGDYGLVISTWQSSMGSHKLSILTADLREVATTASCVKIFDALADDKTWQQVKLEWMNKTYVPVIVIREPRTRKKRRYRGGTIEFAEGAEDKYVMSRDGNAVLAVVMGTKNKIWINHDKCHPEDWMQMMKSSEQCHSLRLPGWIVKKSGML